MKHLLLSALTAATLLPLSAKAPKDPVLMTVDGVPVTLSEFEYLYHKNHGQQIDRQSLDEYLDMFTIYKLKVAEARRQRVDTIQAFQQEFNGYRAELVAPYLRDSLTEKQLVKEAYDHMKESVEVDHLMVPLEKKRLSTVCVRRLSTALTSRRQHKNIPPTRPYAAITATTDGSAPDNFHTNGKKACTILPSVRFPM